MSRFRAAKWKVAQRTFSGGEVLYNGIQLPTPWPPLDVQMYEGAQQVGNLIGRQPLAVPYLTSPPASRIVRTAAGVGGRQLLAIDDWLIKYRGPNVSRVWTAPTLVGAVLGAPFSAWEEFDPGEFSRMGFSGGVWFDQVAGIYKAFTWGGPNATCYFESATGLPGSYTAPNLGDGTNRCKLWTDAPVGHDSDTVWYDPDDADASKRWKMRATRLNPGVSWYQAIHYSADGKVWGAEAARTGEIIDRTTFFRCRFRNKWVSSVRGMLGPQSNPRHRLWFEASGFETTWTHGLNYTYPQDPAQPVMWLRMTGADVSRHDNTNAAFDVDAGGVPGVVSPTELYNVDGCCYESVTVLALSKYDGGPVYNGRPKLNEIQFAFSRNGGFHSTVGYDRVPAIKMSTVAQNVMWGNVQSVNPVVFVDQGKMRFHVSGRAGVPGINLNSGNSSTLMYELRRDGWAGWRFPDGVEDEVRTERLRWFSGTKFYVNWLPSSDPGTQLRAEMRNEVTGQVYPGFSRADSSVVSTDTTGSEITFTGGSISALQGEPIEVRFYGRGGTLFSCWPADNSGGSGGMTHMGRP